MIKKKSPHTPAKTLRKSSALLVDADPLHIKYRPAALEEVVGQDATVNSLRKVLASTVRPHSYLFTGPSGVGKTTLARIVAHEMGCNEVIEVDAATNTGIDAMRKLTESLYYNPMKGGSRMVILDEAHALTKQAWQSLLKIIEEPPQHAYFAFCTTEIDKVPKTVVTRCFSYTLQSVSMRILSEHLLRVAEEEGLDIDDDLLDLAVKRAEGSVRKALVNLAMVQGATNLKEAELLLEDAGGSSDVLELCRLLVSGRASWKECVKCVSNLADTNPESIRIVVLAYTTKVVMSQKSLGDAEPYLAILAAFSGGPFNPSDKLAPVMLALADIFTE